MRFLVPALILACSFIMVSTQYASETPILTKEDAAELVISEILGGNADSVFLHVTWDMVSAGEEVCDLKGTIFTTPSDGWIVFVDDYPTANWEHPCRYFFIDYDSGEYQVYNRITPPEELGVFYWPYPTEAFQRLIEADLVTVEPPSPPSNMMYVPGEKYAVIINGGLNKWLNYVAFWNDVEFIFMTLTYVYQYEKENVFVLFSDGLSDSADMYGSYGMPVDSPKDLDFDNIPDFDGPATLAAVDSVFGILADKIRLNDKLLVYMTDHGGTYGGWETFAYLWGDDILTDFHLQNLYLGLNQCKIMTVLEPSYSGGFIDDLGSNEEGGQGRVFASACRHDEISWMFPDYTYSAFLYFWTSAMSQFNPLGRGDPTLADLNEDGMISFYEAFEYASWMDSLWLGGLETPQYTDDPEELGHYLFLGERYYGPPIAVPFEELNEQIVTPLDRRR